MILILVSFVLLHRFLWLILYNFSYFFPAHITVFACVLQLEYGCLSITVFSTEFFVLGPLIFQL